MYSKFRLKADLLQSYLDQFELYNELKPADIDKERLKVYKQLKNFEGAGGVIDGKALQNYVFPNGKVNDYDIFISYSHNENDEKLVKRFVAYLQDYCGLKVFLDYYVWKSADSLLKKIDDRYCKTRDSKHYIYGRRNYSTSHVHAMLSMAIMDIINKTECCIFINSGHSIHLPSLRKTTTAKTLSPWIYEENKMMLLLPSRLARREVKYFSVIEKAERSDSLKNLMIAYKVNLKGFYTLTCENLKKMRNKGKFGLNELYGSLAGIRILKNSISYEY